MSRMTSLILGLRDRSGGPRWLGFCMLALIAITLGWLALHAVSVMRTAQLPARPEGSLRTDEQRLEEFAAELGKHRAMVDGRSMFFLPPRPRPPRTDPVVDSTPREPPKPTRYGGPSLVAMVNGAVLFSDGQRVKLGESGRGVKVVSMSAPWSARIEWEGVEFDVDLFQRDSTVLRTSHSTTEPTPLTPPPAPKPEADSKPASAPPEPPASSGGEPQPQPEPQPDPQPEPEPEPQPDPNSPDPNAPAPDAPPSPPSNPEPTPEPSAPESP